MERGFLEVSGTLWVALQTSPLFVSNEPNLVWQRLVFSARRHPYLSSRELKAGGNAPEHDDGADGGNKLQALDECGVGDLEQHEPRLDA